MIWTCSEGGLATHLQHLKTGWKTIGILKSQLESPDINWPWTSHFHEFSKWIFQMATVTVTHFTRGLWLDLQRSYCSRLILQDMSEPKVSPAFVTSGVFSQRYDTEITVVQNFFWDGFCHVLYYLAMYKSQLYFHFGTKQNATRWVFEVKNQAAHPHCSVVKEEHCRSS